MTSHHHNKISSDFGVFQSLKNFTFSFETQKYSSRTKSSCYYIRTFPFDYLCVVLQT